MPLVVCLGFADIHTILVMVDFRHIHTPRAFCRVGHVV